MERNDRLDLNELLKNFNNLDQLKTLFWEILNYDRVDQEIHPDKWDTDIAHFPIVFAEAGSQGDFKVLYIKLNSDRLSLMDERTIITQLLHEYPYALFVFSNDNEDTWHFVNVKIAVNKENDDNRKAQKRRLFRRITIAPPYNHLHTAIQRIAMLDTDMVSGRDLFGLSPLAIQKQHDTAFDVEAVTRDFFREYRRVFENAERSITGIYDDEAKRLFTQKLFNRLMFIIFLERKGWLTFDNNNDYILALWEDYQEKHQQGIDTNFYNDRLKLLFFTGLNNPAERDIMNAASRPGMIQERIGDVPYLNGGLFERSDYDEEDSTVVVPDEAIRLAIRDIFYRFNFTVVESTALDIEVAVDPEMLGRIFEELVTGRHESGSYYTPKPIVSFMGREALKGYLQTICPSESENAIGDFVDEHNPDKLNNPEKILDALKKVTICDPACGSGAYLVGMLHELFDLRLALFNRQEIDAITGYERKLEIIQNNIYGVDIDPFAVNIARLRLWLSLIVEFEGNDPLPLPNLDFKIEIGDSIIGVDPSGGLEVDLFRSEQIDRFREYKKQYLKSHSLEKMRLGVDIDNIRDEIIEWARGDKRYQDGFDWAIEFAEVFIDGGFDIVLANPPYIRQELLHSIKSILQKTYGNKYSGTADLYVYFYYRGLQLLKDDGMFAYISSNKWLRANYGKKLRQHLADKHQVVSLTDFGDLPVFQEATAYPLIFIARKGSQLASGTFLYTSVDTLKEPYPDVRALHEQSSNHLPTSLLNSENWTLASEAGTQVLAKLRTNTTPLSKYVNGKIYYGIKTGLNEAFIIDQSKRDELIATDPKCAEVIKPYLRGRDVKRWLVENGGLYIIALQNSNDISANNAWGDATTEQGALRIFEETFPAICTHMMEYEHKLRPRYDQGKWFWELRACAYYEEFEKPKIVYPDIALSPEFAYNTNGSFIGNTAYIIPVGDLYLLSILNSNVMLFFYSQISASIRGGYYRYIAQYMQQIPIPDAPDILCQQITSLAQQCLDIAKDNPDQLPALEAELNALIYQAYGLDDDDITTIENVTKQGYIKDET